MPFWRARERMESFSKRSGTLHSWVEHSLVLDEGDRSVLHALYRRRAGNQKGSFMHVPLTITFLRPSEPKSHRACDAFFRLILDVPGAESNARRAHLRDGAAGFLPHSAAKKGRRFRFARLFRWPFVWFGGHLSCNIAFRHKGHNAILHHIRL